MRLIKNNILIQQYFSLKPIETYLYVFKSFSWKLVLILFPNDIIKFRHKSPIEQISASIFNQISHQTFLDCKPIVNRNYLYTNDFLSEPKSYKMRYYNYKNTMKLFKGLVSNVCGIYQGDENKIIRHIRLKTTQSVDTNDNQNHDSLNEENNMDMERIKKLYMRLEVSQRGRKQPLIRIQGNKKVLLLDLDKTIIYYSQKQGFFLRPHLKQFLKTISESYSIYIFTASTVNYLEFMVKYMEANGIGKEYFSGFLTRQNCITIRIHRQKTIYLKDIKVLINCPPSKIVVVDDTPITYCLNPQNAVPILPYFGQKIDNHLLFLGKTLCEIKDYEDVRDYINGRYIFRPILHSTTSADEVTYANRKDELNKENLCLKKHKSQ